MKNMKTFRVKMVGLLATALILFSAFRADKPVITIFMIGDSTMANKKIDVVLALYQRCTLKDDISYLLPT